MTLHDLAALVHELRVAQREAQRTCSTTAVRAAELAAKKVDEALAEIHQADKQRRMW